MKDLGKALQAKRLELGWTLEQVAEGICAVSYLSMIETGKRVPSKKIAIALKYRLGLNVDELQTLSEDFHRLLLALKVGEYQLVEESVMKLSNLAERDYLNAELLLKRGFAQDALDRHLKLMSNQQAGATIQLMASVSACYLAERLGDIHLAIQIGEKALLDFNSLGSSDDYFELKATLANAYTDAGDLNRAYRIVSDKVEFQSPWQRVMQIWSQIRTLESQNELHESASLVNQALEILKTINKPTVQAQMIQLRCLLQIKIGNADIVDLRRDLATAEDSLRKLNHFSGLANVLETRALAEAKFGDLSEALNAIKSSLDLVTTEEPVVRAQMLTTCAEVQYLRHDIESCLSSLLEARRLLEESKASRTEAKVWRMMADLYQELGDTESVIACLKAATDLLGLGSSTLVVR